MTRTIRKLFAGMLAGAACLLPLATPGTATAQTSLPTATKAPAVKPAAAVAPATPTVTATAAPTTRSMSSVELHKHVVKSTGWVKATRGTGTGWIFDAEKKLMITNEHVVEGAETVAVVFPMWKNGRLVTDLNAYDSAPKVRGVVVHRDKSRDLAMIKLDAIPAGMHALSLAAEEPELNEEVTTVGAISEGSEDLLWGPVSGKVRNVGPKDNSPVRHILSNMLTNSGNSGGPVVNAVGELVGVHYASHKYAKGVSYHVSVADLRAFTKVAVPMADKKPATTPTPNPATTDIPGAKPAGPTPTPNPPAGGSPATRPASPATRPASPPTPTPNPPAAEPKPVFPTKPTGTPNPGVGNINPQMVGTWAGGYVASNGAKMAQVMKFNADGTYEMCVMIEGPKGKQTLEDKGTWTASNGALTLNGKEFGRETWNYSFSGGNLKLDLKEVGIVVTLGKV